MKLSELNNKDKVKMIIDFLGWSLVNKNDPEISVPAVFWNEFMNHWYVFYEHDNLAYIFDPLHDLHDAWHLIKRIADLYMTPRDDNDARINDLNIVEKVTDILLDDSGYRDIFPGQEVFVLMSGWTPESISSAVLQASDVEMDS